jgi:hypothetical protein
LALPVVLGEASGWAQAQVQVPALAQVQAQVSAPASMLVLL